jgi:GNAT superfamily N-acetyltransferase
LSAWTPRRVLDAAIALEWRPDGALDVQTADYRLIRYPDWALDPTFAAAQVLRSRAGRPAGEVIDEVMVHVRGWGLPGMAWWVSDATRPADTEDILRARGGKQIDAVRILARELGAELPDLDVPPDVTAELVTSERLFRAASGWTGFRVVAFADGEAASSGGCTLDGEVAKLWGAVTLPEFRRRGTYRAVLAERLRLARDHGATLALVKGRVATSRPILVRAGFADYDEERCYWLPL